MRKIKKIIGLILYNLIAKHLPSSTFVINIGQKAFRAFCARLILDRCGKKVNVEKNATFSSRIQLGDRSGIGSGSLITGKCTIGNDVMMGPNCIIYTINHKIDDVTVAMNTQGNAEEKPVVIGDDVWIGGRVIILPGVKIGSHSVIGAGAVVTKDVPEWAIAAGNPATVKKYRK